MRNRGFDFRSPAPPGRTPPELLEHLVAKYPHSGRESWARRIADGTVRVEGGTLVWSRPPWDEPEAPTSFEVLREDDEILAVFKPSGLPTLPGGGFLETTLLHLVRERTAGASPLHRLGRFTSGIVLFAKTAEAHRALSEQWRRREVTKRYRALASGLPERDVFVVDTPIGPVPYAPHGFVHAASAAGKPARTRVAVVRLEAESFVADVVIESGRPHQIRIHLAAAGHPLVGDPLFGPGGIPREGTVARVGEGGYLLHAAELRFRHPGTGREEVVLSPPPVDALK